MMLMLLEVIFIITGNILFLYLFWKKLKEDYTSNQIFTTAIYIGVSILVGQLISQTYFADWWFWTGMLGVLVGVGLGVAKFKLRIMEVWEAAVIGLLPGLSMVFLYNAIKHSDKQLYILSGLVLILIFLFLYLDKHYKMFTWYKSGRIGFSGLTVLGVFFLMRSTIAVVFPTMLFFVGKKDIYLSALIAFVCFLGVFTLARKNT